MACTALDGTPRVVPLRISLERHRVRHLHGAALAQSQGAGGNPYVALTIDTAEFPPHALLVRGTAALELVPGIPPEYLEAARKQVGAEGMPAFAAQVRELHSQMTRIRLTPTWAKVLDFETRLPTPVEQLIKQHQASGR